jgi:holo-[acyl-carrier protein] synthase
VILGIGTDLTSIDRIAATLEEQGERFIERCFALPEREKVEKAAKGDARLRAAGYAKRWAAKEACAKALGIGVSGGVYMKDMTVVNAPDGRPQLVLSGGAKDRLTALTPRGMTPQLSISLSDDGLMALAFVIIAGA